MNNAALDAAIDWAAKNPEQHNQGFWRCGTSMCIAGILCHLDDETTFHSSAVDYRAVTYVGGNGVLAYAIANELVRVGDQVMDVPTRAQQILDTTDTSKLFDAIHTLDGVREAAAELAAREAVNA